MLLRWSMKTYEFSRFSPYSFEGYVSILHKHRGWGGNKAHTFQKIVFKVIFPSSKISIYISVSCEIKYKLLGVQYTHHQSDGNCGEQLRKRNLAQINTTCNGTPTPKPGHRHPGIKCSSIMESDFNN